MILAILAAAAAATAAPIADCRAIDGDTLRCGAERVRLLGIDAPELPGHCRMGRQCVVGDPYASWNSLSDALRRGPMMIERRGFDHYGRTLAAVSAGGEGLSCWQLRARQAVYVPRRDEGGGVARSCSR